MASCGNNYVPLKPSVCNIGATKTDQEIPDCGGGRKRLSDCGVYWIGADHRMEQLTYSQIIKVVDHVDPYIDISVLNQDITVSTDPWGCEKVNNLLPWPEHLSDNCSEVSYWVEIPGITNDPFNLGFDETHVSFGPHSKFLG